jgi:alpha-amylase
MIPGARVMMWLNYRQNGNGEGTFAVPAPVDAATPDAPWWYDRVCQLAPELAAAGFTDVLLPNPVIGQGAPGPGDDGYNPVDDYDIGGKGTPTRYGTREQFQRAVAVCQANGLNVLLDHVMHQRMGGDYGIYRYKSATGKTNGRFAKTPDCFRWNGQYGVDADPVPDPPNDFAFGDELCPVNAKPAGYVWNGLLAAADWLFRSSGADGARLDDMKGINAGFMNAFLDAGFAQGKFWMGEYDDGNPDTLNWYEGQIGGRMSLEDFAFQENRAYPMCMKAGSGAWRMDWMGSALLASNPMHAVPFVSSMDSETDGWATIVDNKILAYALMLGGEGLPMVYCKDYLSAPTDPACYGLGAEIANLVWCHQALANGGTELVHADAKSYVFRRTGAPGLLVALNNDIWNPNWTNVTVRPGFAPGTVLHDYTGRNGMDCVVRGDGTVSFGIPPAANGRGYGMWAPAGLGGALPTTTRATTQTLFGAADLDVGPAVNGTFTVSPRLCIARGSRVHMQVSADTAGWAAGGASVTFQLAGPSGRTIGTSTQGASGSAVPMQTIASETGWHTLTVTGTGLPDAGSAWQAKITYTAPKEI